MVTEKRSRKNSTNSYKTKRFQWKNRHQKVQIQRAIETVYRSQYTPKWSSPNATIYFFEESCFLDLEDNQGQMIDHTPGTTIDHNIGSNVEPEDCDDEITCIEELMRANSII
jgi:hypothetical protein